MKIEIQDSFSEKLLEVLDFISKDKPIAARKFKADILKKIKSLQEFQFQCKKSIYFNENSIRDMVFKGYTVVYRVDSERNMILIFGLIKNKETMG